MPFLFRKCDDPTCYISINEIISHQKRMDGSDGVGKSRRGSLQPGSDDEDQIGHSGSAGIADMKSRLNTRRGSFVPPKSPSMTRCSCGSRWCILDELFASKISFNFILLLECLWNHLDHV